MSEKNKEIVRRYLTAIGEGDVATIEELVDPNHTCDFGSMKTHNIEEYKQLNMAFAAAFPDLSVTIESQIAEGDLEVHRWTGRGTHTGEYMGIPATGKPVEFTTIFMTRIADGKIVEEWGLMDIFAIMQQIGALPTTG